MSLQKIVKVQNQNAFLEGLVCVAGPYEEAMFAVSPAVSLALTEDVRVPRLIPPIALFVVVGPGGF